jgi:hypothetical protein
LWLGSCLMEFLGYEITSSVKGCPCSSHTHMHAEAHAGTHKAHTCTHMHSEHAVARVCHTAMEREK